MIVHLRYGPPPSPDGPRYNLLALGPEKLPPAESATPVDPGTTTTFPGRMMGGPPRRPPNSRIMRKSAGPRPLGPGGSP